MRPARCAALALVAVVLVGCGDDCASRTRFAGTVEVVDADGRAAVVRTPEGRLTGLLAAEEAPTPGEAVSGTFVEGTLVLD